MPAPVTPVLGASVAFYVVFSAFVVAFVVLTVITLTWAVRRDRAGRRAWAERRQRERPQSSPQDPASSPAPGPTGNGRSDPGQARKGHRRP